MRGDIAFEPALRERVALLEGLPVSVIEEVLRDRIKLTPGGKTLVATMRANGAVTCMVSGGFTLFTDRIAAMIGFDKNRANKLTLVDGRKLTGKVADPIFGRNGKRAALIELRRVCRPGGWLLVTVPAYQALWSRHDVANHHFRRYSRPRLRGAAAFEDP